ncbi:uncharacterized protein LOC144633313 [Oculina patagonica]
MLALGGWNIYQQMSINDIKRQLANGGSSTDDNVPHKIEPSTSYRIWNKQTASLLQHDPNNAINCNGSSGVSDQTVFTTLGAGRDMFAFTVNQNSYVLDGPSNNGPVTAVAYSSSSGGTTITNSMRFVPSYYWGFTMFKSVAHNTYLGCSNDGSALLIDMASTNYPDPRAMFNTILI